MSYGIMPYSVKAEDIEKLFGTGDSPAKRTTLVQTLGQFQRKDDFFGGTQMAEIAEDFFAGKITWRDEAYKYWYFIEILCTLYGRMLNNGEWYPASGAYSAMMDSDVFKISGIYTKPSIPSADDFPTVFVVRNVNLDTADQFIRERGKTGEYNEAQVTEFDAWVNHAKSRGEDLILYYY